jgi:hypothetical protein
MGRFQHSLHPWSKSLRPIDLPQNLEITELGKLYQTNQHIT